MTQNAANAAEPFMILTFLFTLSGATPAPLAVAGAPLAAIASLDGVAELESEFDAAKDSWRQRLREAEGIKQKKAIRAEHPVKAFWPRFEAIAAGKAKDQAFMALLWMSENVRDRGLRLSELDVERRALAERILGHQTESWFAPGVPVLIAQRKAVGDEWLLEALRSTAAKNEAKPVQAAALFEAAKLIRRIGGEGAEAEAKSILKRLAQDYAETEWGMRARGEMVTPEDLMPGKVAPDFMGETIDGHQFKLSDYRGKVVLLDFYGFW